tara:strand:- start:7 stop:258 length:252 start_codon:yes stop_codon:yes gene_type:complete
MRSKKNVGVVEMIDYANMQLARTDDFATREFKTGISIMVETVLHKSGNYDGFGFLNRDAKQEETNSDGSEFYNRFYYTSNKLK